VKSQYNQLPGVAGIFGGKSPSHNAQRIAVMLRVLAYGGREKAGIFNDEKTGVCIGWTRRSSSSNLKLPVWNEAHNTALLWWGETFEDALPNGNPQIERCLEFLQAYEREEIQSIKRLNGWFAGIIVDLNHRKAVLFNDRYGLCRLHFYETDHGFYFSSEAKALLAIFPEVARLDPKSAGEFISCGAILQNRTMFSGISLLPGASAWTFSGKRQIRKNFYFRKEEWENQSPLNAEEYYKELRQTWTQILPRYLSDKQSCGLSLTGGVDSRMIIAYGSHPAGDLKCYTFAGEYRDSADLILARKTAEICRRPHETIYVGRSFLAEFPELAADSIYISDGTMDVSGSVDLYVQRIAQQIAPVRVTGTNGGEIMRGLVAFKPSTLCLDAFKPDLQVYIKAAEKTYQKELEHKSRLSFTAFKQTPWYMNPKFLIERSQISLRMPYFDNNLVQLVFRAPGELTGDNKMAFRLIADANPALAAIDSDRGLKLRSRYGLTSVKHGFQQFTYKLEYAFDYGMPSWLAIVDRLLSPLHPERFILGRHKFHHFRIWYRDKLSEYIKEILLDPCARRRPYLSGSGLEKMVRSHIQGSANYTREIHKILSLELTERLLIENSIQKNND
jgi:asparagine synthase (glutamine-hydrolysing)